MVKSSLCMKGILMNRIAQVCVNLPARNIDKVFSYAIPETLHFLDIGWRVVVPFGSRTYEGFIVALSEETSSEYEVKPIIDVLDSQAWFSDSMLQTAKWISEHYLCTLAEAMRLFIPGKTGIKSEKQFGITPGLEQAAVEQILSRLPPQPQAVYDYLKTHDQVVLSKLKKIFGDYTEAALNDLLANKLIVRTTAAKKRAVPQFTTSVRLAIPLEEAEIYLETLAGKPAQKRLLALLLQKEEVKYSDLSTWQITRDTVNRMLKAGLVKNVKHQVLRNSYAGMGRRQQTVRLTPEQQQTIDHIIPAIDEQQYRSFLLHGITGSGKTQVYIEAVAAVRQQDRQAIVLVPEIALTSQIVSRFKERFGEDVVVMHSKLSIGERHDAWQRLQEESAGIVIGARSAVFSPVTRLGIIVIDEEHEFTYKQEEQPHYHTRQVAAKRTELEGAVLLLGSATPSLETYYAAQQGRHGLLTLDKRIDHSLLPDVRIVDMREELAQGRRSVISAPLQQLLADTLRRQEQAIILLNRRGYATFVLCRECGHIIKCKHCSVSMVYHNSSNMLRCHYCQASCPAPDICPVCASRYIRYFGTGTQKLEEELGKIFPQARVIRMDQDSTSRKMAHDRIIASFSRGEYDILLGTQMVAKGHDIKNVTAVGIISADSALNLPDFRSAERTFSLLTQAAGRAGRGDKAGQVIIQTYNPEHYAIMASSSHNYEVFYRQEIEARKSLQYPPFSELLKLTVYSSDENQARSQAEQIVRQLGKELQHDRQTEIIGPFAAPIAKINNSYRVNILIKSKELTNIKSQIVALKLNSRSDVLLDIEPLNIL